MITGLLFTHVITLCIGACNNSQKHIMPICSVDLCALVLGKGFKKPDGMSFCLFVSRQCFTSVLQERSSISLVTFISCMVYGDLKP